MSDGEPKPVTAPMLPPSARPCPTCGSDIALALLACPGCRTLVHRDELERLAAAARAAEGRDDVLAALDAWRQALPLVPPATRQRSFIKARIAELGRRAEDITSATPPARSRDGRPLHLQAWGIAGALVLFVLGKGKLLLVGLTKLTTVVSMLAFAGVFWRLYGWEWALGVALSIYVHEMGHVAALTRYGVRASAPMFVPGVGAFVAYQQRLGDPRQEARVALAGPLWGLGAGLAAWGLGWWTGRGTLAAVAATSGIINLINMVPAWILDGAHAFKPLARWQRVAAALLVLALWPLLDSDWAGLLGAAALVMAFVGRAPEKGDGGTLAYYVAVSAALAWLATTHAPW